jgi:hypothetical protein
MSMASNVTGFNSSNSLVQCYGCGRLTWSHIARTKGVNGEACKDCAREWYAENDHNDNGRHTYSSERDCQICHPETREARLVKVAAHNAEIQIKAESYAADRKQQAAAKAAEQAAKDAATKFCKAADCDNGTDGKPGKASKTSDYCSICRPYNPHTATKLSRSDREMFARRGWNTDACGTCGKDADYALHTSA